MISTPHINTFEIFHTNTNGKIKKPDLLSVEEPLEIRLGYGESHKRKQKSIAVTMRTPGNDLELVLGFLFTEGIIKSRQDILSIKHCKQVEEAYYGNVVTVELDPEVSFDSKSIERHFYTSSSCGVCGKASIEALKTTNSYTQTPTFEGKVDKEIIKDLAKQLSDHQLVFNHTGSLHATALFNSEGKLKYIREDIGRHNAFDKVIGISVNESQIPLHDHMVLVSGRLSFELVQKAVMAGVPILAAIGGPSTLAVELAQEFNITLIGFLRDEHFNIYSGEHRIG